MDNYNIKKQCQFCSNRGVVTNEIISELNRDGTVSDYNNLNFVYDLAFCRHKNKQVDSFDTCDKFNLDTEFILAIIRYFGREDILDKYKEVK